MMLSYELSRETRMALALFARDFQAAVQEVANRLKGWDNPSWVGIALAEGGVTVNACEIVMTDRFVVDRDKRSGGATEEEKAVVSAIEIVTKAFDEERASGRDGAAAFPPYRRENVHYANPLRAMIIDFAK
jgi:hypothetical protein